jgi:hypothetical protein
MTADEIAARVRDCFGCSHESHLHSREVVIVHQVHEGSFFTSRVFFSDAIGDNASGVLGQQGFFNHFDITFRTVG